MKENTATNPIFRFAVYILFGFLCFFLVYFTERENFIQLISIVTCLFAIYLGIILYWKQENFFKEALFIAVLIRVSLIFSVPNLSDDFYRFIWDGSISNAGYNPYAFTPNEIAANDTVFNEDNRLSKQLFVHLNSKDYYSVYPPLCQGIFYIANQVSGPGFYNDIWWLKTIIVLFEIGTLFFLIKILTLLNFRKTNAFIYAFNPLIILELSGNIHFEAGMIFFLTVAIYFLLKDRQLYSSLLFGLAVSIKLWPLMFLPLLIQRIGWVKTFQYSGAVILLNVCLFAPFLTQDVIHHYQTSLKLYVSTFSFNASTYYLISWLLNFNYSSILKLQAYLPVILMLLIFTYSFTYSKHPFVKKFVLVFTSFLLLSTTIHPWYLSCLIMLSSIYRFSFPIVWSFLIYLTYATYITPHYSENYLFIFIEYSLVLIVVWYEIKHQQIHSKYFK